MAQKPVVVVGGGLGGMSAAIASAQLGRPVVLLESQPRLGGCAVAFHRGPYTFDLALHAVAGGGDGGPFRELVSRLGLAETVRFARVETDLRVRMGERVFDLPNDADGLFRFLERSFPSQRAGLAHFRRDVERRTTVYGPILDPWTSAWRSAPRFLPHAPAFLRDSYRPAGEYLDRFITDPVLKSLLLMPSVFLGQPSDELPAVNFMMMFRMLFLSGFQTMPGGGQSVTDAMEHRMRMLGVRVVTRTPACRILTERGRAIAVRSADGTDYDAAGVIAAVSLPQVAGRLLGPDVLKRGYRTHLERLHPSLPVLVLNLGLTASASEVGIAHYLTICFPSPDVDDTLRRQRRSGDAEGFSITAREYGDMEGGLAPPTLSVVAGTDAEPWLRPDAADYRDSKARAAEALLGRLASLYPRIRSRVAVSDLATPRTLVNYTGNPGGAIMGFACTPGSHRHLAAVSRIPVRHLHLAGAWTRRLGGFMPSMQSGWDAAHRLHREIA